MAHQLKPFSEFHKESSNYPKWTFIHLYFFQPLELYSLIKNQNGPLLNLLFRIQNLSLYTVHLGSCAHDHPTNLFAPRSFIRWLCLPHVIEVFVSHLLKFMPKSGVFFCPIVECGRIQRPFNKMDNQ